MGIPPDHSLPGVLTVMLFGSPRWGLRGCKGQGDYFGQVGEAVLCGNRVRNVVGCGGSVWCRHVGCMV